MEHITSTKWKFSIGQMQHEVKHLLQNINFNGNQISITSRPNALVPIYDCVWNLWDGEKKCYIAKEHDFTEINKEFKGTYLEHVYNTINTEIPVGRVRLLRLPSRTCYKIHKDSGLTKYHLAIQTNDSALIVYRDIPPYHIPADGVVYQMNARVDHTALNGDSDKDGEDRIHLVFHVCPTSYPLYK